MRAYDICEHMEHLGNSLVEKEPSHLTLVPPSNHIASLLILSNVDVLCVPIATHIVVKRSAMSILPSPIMSIYACLS